MYDPDTPQPADIRGAMVFPKRRPAPAGDRESLRTAAEFMAEAAENRETRQTRSNLDSPQAESLHSRLMSFFAHEMDAQAENRAQMAADEDLFDHIQYTDDELASYADRGQSPVVYNIVQTTVNWLLGTQRRAPRDYKILPRLKEGLKAAAVKTQLFKHLSDTNLLEYQIADAFESAVKAGVGWLESGQGRPEDGSKVFSRAEKWRFMLWDSTAQQYDLSDARYQFRAKWLDLDVAETMWHGRRGAVRESVRGTVLDGWSDDNLGDEAMDAQEAAHFDTTSTNLSRGLDAHSRQRVRVIEAWFKRPVVKAPFMRGGQFHGERFDPWSIGHLNDLNAGLATITTRPAELMHVALFTERGLLDLQQSPFRHNRFPFTPVWGYRRARDGMPYGLIRGVRDIQRSLNRQKSKALHFLASTRVHVEEGAVDDIEELRTEAGRPDAVIVRKKGAPAPMMETQAELAGVHVEMAREDAALIQQVGGVTDENLGRRTNATSGIAIERRQDQGSLATSMFFDNLRRSRMIDGEKLLCLIEMYYTDRDVIRITDARGRPDWVTLNGDDDSLIAAHKADFIITEEDWRATVRQHQADMLFDITTKLAQAAPQLALKILDLVVEATELPKRDEIVKRIRQISGTDDPDADPDNPDPETVARKKAEAAQAEMMARMAMAEVQEKEGKARKTTAEAAKAEHGLAGDAIARIKAALEAAIAIAGAPAVAAATDQVLSLAMAEGAAALAPQAGAQPAPFQDPLAMQPQGAM